MIARTVLQAQLAVLQADRRPLAMGPGELRAPLDHPAGADKGYQTGIAVEQARELGPQIAGAGRRAGGGPGLKARGQVDGQPLAQPQPRKQPAHPIEQLQGGMLFGLAMLGVGEQAREQRIKSRQSRGAARRAKANGSQGRGLFAAVEHVVQQAHQLVEGLGSARIAGPGRDHGIPHALHRLVGEHPGQALRPRRLQAHPVAGGVERYQALLH